jgi:hypothetical protein
MNTFQKPLSGGWDKGKSGENRGPADSKKTQATFLPKEKRDGVWESTFMSFSGVQSSYF